MGRHMRKVGKLGAVVGAAALAVTMTPGTGSAAGTGDDSKSAQGMQTTQRGTEQFIDLLPCASDTGFFDITLRYNSTERFSDSRGHVTQTGTFVATPVTPTELVVEEHDDHIHEIPVAGVQRDGATYSGRFTLNGTWNDNGRAATGTFNFVLHGTSSDGESVQARSLFHQTTVEGVTRSLLERETCR